MDCRLPGSSVHGIFLAKILEWVTMPFSRGSSQPKDRTLISCVSCIAGRFFTHWATWEALLLLCLPLNSTRRVTQLRVNLLVADIWFYTISDQSGYWWQVKSFQQMINLALFVWDVLDVATPFWVPGNHSVLGKWVSSLVKWLLRDHSSIGHITSASITTISYGAVLSLLFAAGNILLCFLICCLGLS